MKDHMPRDDVLYSNAFFAEKDLSLSWPVQAALPANLVCTSVFCTRPHSLVGPLACPCTPISGAWYLSNASMQEGAVAGLAGVLSTLCLDLLSQADSGGVTRVAQVDVVLPWQLAQQKRCILKQRCTENLCMRSLKSKIPSRGSKYDFL